MKKFISVLLVLLQITGIAGACLLSYVYGAPRWFFVVMAASYLFACLFVPAVHEAGHLFFGNKMQMRLRYVLLTFWRIERAEDKTVVKRVNPFSYEPAGECAMYPVGGKDIEKRFLWYSLGGVLLNGALLLLTLPFLLLFYDNFVVWATLGIVAVYDAYILLLNALPLSDSSDGTVFWGLLKKDSSIVVATRILMVEGLLAEGKTPGQVDKNILFSVPQLPEDDRYFSVLQYYRYHWYMDRDDWKSAIRCIQRLESCLEYVPDEYLPYIYCELTYVYGGIEQNLAKAEQYYTALGYLKGLGLEAPFVRAKLTYAKACDLYDLEKEALTDIRDAIEKESVAGIRTYEKKLLEELCMVGG